MTDALRAAAEQALEALTESLDLVCEDYRDNWRHGIPTRAAQLDGLRKGVEAHEAAISALTSALAAPVAPAAQPALHIAFGARGDSIRFWASNKRHAAEWERDNGEPTHPYYSAPVAPAQPAGEVVVTRTMSGRIVAVTRQDAEGRILSVIAEADEQPAQPEPDAEHTEQYWLHRIEMERTAAWQQGYAQGLHRSKQQSAEPREGWRPIETAPRSGDHMLLSDGTRVSLGGWISDIEHGAEYEGQIGMAGWWAVDLGPNNDRPTHWMPLPAAPQPTPAAVPADTMTVQEVWELAGGNPGVQATRAEVEVALRQLDEVCDEAAAVPLTRHEINELMKAAGWQNSALRQADLDGVERVVRAVEAKAGITGAAREQP